MPTTPTGSCTSDLLLGVAVSDHQCESYDPECPDIWDLWERRAGMTPRGRATDFQDRFEEDVELARRLGLNAFRLSIAWARVEPRPGEWDEAAFERYLRLLRTIRAAGMEPVVTLMHWVWPEHVEARGGLAAPGFPDWFRRYASEVARRLGAEARRWLTLNEPNALPFGFIRYWWQKDYPMPPGLGDTSAARQVETVVAVVRNLFLAHAAARDELRSIRPDSQVSANPCVLGLPVAVQSWLDRHCTESLTEEEWRTREERAAAGKPAGRGWWSRLGGTVRKLRSLGLLCNHNWWYLGLAGRLPAYLCPAECVGAQDFVALDYYWGIPALRLGRVAQLLGAVQQQYGQAPVWPKGLYLAMRSLHRMFPGQEILIAENGCPARDDGLDRLTYLKRHLGEVLRARRHGTPVFGYLCWSLTTCREWGLPDRPQCDFGLYRIDLETPDLTRHPTRVSEGFRELIESVRRDTRT